MRIVRVATRPGLMHLVVQGPRDETDTREFTDAVACASYQADLERRLVSQGYSLERFTSERRDTAAGGHGHASDRRRNSQLFL